MPPTGPSRDRWERTAELFGLALDLEPGAREEFLSRECAHEPEVLTDVRELLRSHEGSGALDELAQRLAHDVDLAVDGLQHPEHIGPFRVSAVLGAGGMGVVYHAEREGADFSQQVAIKLLHPARRASGLVERFISERSILARLSHPGIPRFIDGGLTTEGVPYFAMEFVEGEPITRYAADRELSVKERVTLFLGVCDAVQYAHQHLVVHRDLKPGNILVTPDGSTKVLDFGIARVLDSHDPADSSPAQKWMTPEYASPEQLRGEGVSTASDVYSLAVVLHEMLVGRRPSEQGGRDALAAGDLPADLGLVLYKALREEPALRYQTATEFAADLRRLLADLPVRARAASAGYRFRKFARRNPALVVTASLALLVVIFAAIATWEGARRAHVAARDALLARDRAEAVTDFVVRLFADADPMRSGGGISAAALLDSGAARLSAGFVAPDRQPSTHAAMLEVLGQSYEGLGRHPDAIRLNLEALRVLRAAVPLDTIALAGALATRSRLLMLTGNPDSARVAAREAVRLARAKGETGRDLASGLTALGGLLQASGDLDSAEVYLREARAAIAGKGDWRTDVALMTSLTDLYAHSRRTAEAEAMIDTIVRVRSAHQPEGHPEIAGALRFRGGLRLRLGKVAEARSDLEIARRSMAASLGPEHPYVASADFDLGKALERLGELRAADSAFTRAATGFTARLGANSVVAGRTHLAQGSLRITLGDRAGARTSLETALRALRATLPAGHPDIAKAESELARAKGGG